MSVDTTTTEHAPRSSRGWRWAWKALSVRLRFLLVLAVALAAVSQWDVLRTFWDKVTRGASHADPGFQPVSGDTEYFCPMDPGVVSDWPGKCGICNMALVRRKRGDMAPLPDGVLARTQLSPYRLQLGGIRTAAVGYEPLVREVDGPGHVIATDLPGQALIEMHVFASQATGLDAGREVRIERPAGGEPLQGKLRSARSDPDDPQLLDVSVQVEDPLGQLIVGEPVRATVRIPIVDLEPFRSMATEPPALRKGERRALYVCADHPEIVRDAPGRCPTDSKLLERRDLQTNQRLRWWCPMHPAVTADHPGEKCKDCGGMTLVPRVITYRPAGKVLAVPEPAVVDTGKRTVVYVERMPGMFDAVEVVLGPRCGGMYPVIRGLEAGQRVVASGAFLVDAETKLNPSIAASYFGAARSEQTVSAPRATDAPDDGLSAADRALVATQKTCPVTRKPLGSMGTPVRVEVAGRTVFLCCDGCESKLRSDPARYLGQQPPPQKPQRAP